MSLSNTHGYDIERKTRGKELKHHSLVNSSSSGNDYTELKNLIIILQAKQKQLEEQIKNFQKVQLQNENLELEYDDDFLIIKKKDSTEGYDQVRIQWGNIL
jgi:hypothetical protein